MIMYAKIFLILILFLKSFAISFLSNSKLVPEIASAKVFFVSFFVRIIKLIKKQLLME